MTIISYTCESNASDFPFDKVEKTCWEIDKDTWIAQNNIKNRQEGMLKQIVSSSSARGQQREM